MATAVAVAPAQTSSMMSRAKRKFFSSHDPYVEYHRQSSPSSCTVYGSAFSPSRGGGGGGGGYFVACTSGGCVAVWDVGPSGKSRGDGGDRNKELPVLTVQVVPGDETTKNRVLYDLQFLHTGGGDHLLVVSGDPGVLVYKWSDFLEEIDATSDADCECAPSRKRSMCQDPKVGESSSSRRSPFVELRPITRFRPHPSPSFSGESVEINSTSYGKSDNVLFGAAGDAFGCYQWDLSTGSLLGTFGGARGGHRDYLHVVKSFDDCVLTGGEDGCIGFWDGKCRKLIEMVSVQSTMEKNKSLVTSDAAPSNTGFLGSNSSLKAGSSLYVSSMDTSGNWLAACGGSESTSNNILSSRSSSTSAGFMTLWHLPSRSFTSGRVTRESLNTVASNQSLDCFVSGGNEGRISFWESASLTRAGRSWCTPPATYTMSVDPESNWMVLGGSGGKLDCFVDRVKVAQLQLAE